MNSNILNEEPISNKLISKWFRAYVFVIFTAPLWYFIRLLASNTLSVSDVWIIYWVIGLFILLSCYNDLGLTESMQYFLPKYRLEGKKWQIKNTILLSFLMQLTTWIIIFLLVFFNAERLAIHHFHEIRATYVIKVMSLYFLWCNILQVCNTIFSAFQDTFSSWITWFFRLLSTLLFSVIFWIGAGFDLWIFALSRVMWVCVAILIWFIQLLRKYKDLLKLPRDKLDKSLVSKQFKYAFRVFLTANIWSLLWNLDQQFVLNKLWSEASWYFSNMLSLLGVFTSIISPLVSLMFPITTELFTRKEKDKFKLLESLMYTYLAVLTIIVWWISLVFWQEISVLLFWEKFRFSWELLQIIWPFLIFNCLSGLNFSLLAWLWKIKERFNILLISLIINVVCNVLVLFVFELDLHAVICVLALSRCVQFAIWLRYIMKEYPFNFDRKFFIKNLLLVWLLCIIILLRKEKIITPNQNRLELLLVLLLICIVYMCIIAWFNRWKIKSLRSEIKRIRKSES